jgi:hypothetical protein
VCIMENVADPECMLRIQNRSVNTCISSTDNKQNSNFCQ